MEIMIIRYKKGQSNTNLKRHLFINEFLYLSVLIWGSWNRGPFSLTFLTSLAATNLEDDGLRVLVC